MAFSAAGPQDTASPSVFLFKTSTPAQGNRNFGRPARGNHKFGLFMSRATGNFQPKLKADLLEGRGNRKFGLFSGRATENCQPRLLSL